jgi:hypothetical protein
MSNIRRITVERVATITLLIFSLLSVYQVALAQVGHRPESSPYRDLQARRVLSFAGGYLNGSSGTAKVGPGGGPFAGARFDLHLSGPAALSFGAGMASLQRIIIDPTWGPENRTLDTASQSILLLDANFDMLLTGEKTWHGMIPYFGVGLGFALGGDVPADSLSGYSFSTHFTTGPHLGVWLIPSRLFSFRVEVRDRIWRLKYPDGFFSVPANEPTELPVLDANIMKDTQWVNNLTLTFTLGYTIGN